MQSAGNTQGGITFRFHIFYLCAQCPQGIYQDADGALFHPGCTSQGMCSLVHRPVSRKETHGRTGRHDVDGVVGLRQCPYHNECVVAVRHISRQVFSSGQCMDDEGPVADAFAGRQYGFMPQV